MHLCYGTNEPNILIYLLAREYLFILENFVRHFAVGLPTSFPSEPGLVDNNKRALLQRLDIRNRYA